MDMNQLASLANSGSQMLLPVLKSIASSLICQWYKNNVVIRYKIGEMGSVTQFHVLWKAETAMTMTAVKWDCELKGAPYTSQLSNQRSNPDGRLPTLLAVAINVRKSTSKRGQLNLQTYEEVADINPSAVPLYSEIEDSLIGKFRLLHGFDDDEKFEGGFKNASWPGPVFLDVGDVIEMATMGSDNFDQPAQTFSSVKGFITGTLTWQLEQQTKKVAPVTENFY